VTINLLQSPILYVVTNLPAPMETTIDDRLIVLSYDGLHGLVDIK